MHKCSLCGKEFETLQELESHDAGHLVRPVKEDPLTVLLTLPDGCCPGRWEAAEAFTDAIQELKEKYPDKDFQFIPFSFADGGVEPSLNSIFAVAL